MTVIDPSSVKVCHSGGLPFIHYLLASHLSSFIAQKFIFSGNRPNNSVSDTVHQDVQQFDADFLEAAVEVWLSFLYSLFCAWL